jgi:hypothetical protein
MANPRYDFKLVNNDLYIDPVAGDLVAVVADEQYVQDTINIFPGWDKQHPADGVGAFAYVNSSGQNQVLARNIIQQLQSDGYQSAGPVITQNPDGTLVINPNVV